MSEDKEPKSEEVVDEEALEGAAGGATADWDEETVDWMPLSIQDIERGAQ